MTASDVETEPSPVASTATAQARPRGLLALLVIAQWACTSLWFAANGALPSLKSELGLSGQTGNVTSAVQLGFISGTALMAFSGLADRWPAPKLFFRSAALGALCNVLPVAAPSLQTVLLSRFLVGLSLAGIYPVGMKLATSWFEGGLGRALGYLVGALVLGTALPHLFEGVLDWRGTLISVSILALVGGVLVRTYVRTGPFVSKASFNPRAIVHLLRNTPFRRAALAYFGHMWELYTFWAFVPVLLAARDLPNGTLSFSVIAAGAAGCVAGGYLAAKTGSRRVALLSLVVSASCCLLVPMSASFSNELLVAFLMVWGFAAVSDSPQLSALTAKASPPSLVGTAFALVTSVGFALTIASLSLAQSMEVEDALTWLALGPLVGATALLRVPLPEPHRPA